MSGRIQTVQRGIAAEWSRTVDGEVEYRVTWLKGSVIGHAAFRRAGDTPLMSATVWPLKSVSRAEVGATVRDKDFGETIVRSLTLHFVRGDPLIIDIDTFSAETQGDRADAFINAVLDALSSAPGQPKA